MKLLPQLFLILLSGLFIGCEPDPCEDVACGPGECIEGICDCPDGFTGANCEIEICFGVPCINGDCEQETETCHCDPNYYGEQCDRLCVNGEFENGKCNCSVGYEGLACEIESRDRILGWWGCQQWTMASQLGGAAVPGFIPGSIKLECGNRVPEIELVASDNSNGMMLLSLGERLVGEVTETTVNFPSQFLTNEVRVYGSANLGVDRRLTIELYFFNTTTSVTEVAKGTFTLYRNIKLCP